MDVNRFEVGESFCLLTLRPVATCPHCLELREEPPRPARVVTAIDHDAGTVTIDGKGP